MKIKERKTKIKQIVLKATKQLASTLIDVVVIEAGVIAEILTTPPGSLTMGNLDRRISQRFGLSPSQAKNAVQNAQKKGWIRKDFKLTRQGEKRLKQILPSYRKPPKWDKKWYLVIFDIPEKLRWKRDVLREKLKTLGLGQLQQSVWLSPYNYLYNIQQIVKRYHLEPYVILSVTDKLGQEESQFLAQKVWRLEEINQEYKDFIAEYSSLKKKKIKENQRFGLKIAFLAILRRDPQLPCELLPESWQASKAFVLYKALN